VGRSKEAPEALELVWRLTLDEASRDINARWILPGLCKRMMEDLESKAEGLSRKHRQSPREVTDEDMWQAERILRIASALSQFARHSRRKPLEEAKNLSGLLAKRLAPLQDNPRRKY